ncbi:unnamed protein product [Polarella glacialis]|uniref:Uncharacterized protein n=1 Tax=Polarella glacialis TaxID=89957 RepID=A0A813HW62_POLGL|nr:unnamed protein product [Polarella glacialis]
MMRVVCPNCGEEPQKGQRHYCKPAQQAPRQQLELDFPQPASRPSATGAGGDANRGGLQRRAAPCATAGAMCASVASLASKNPGLWKSGRTLARCSGEDFVAGLLASAVGQPFWHRDPKRALLCTLTGRVADEAARAVQDFWRQVLRRRQDSAPRRTAGTVGGYQQLLLAQVKPAKTLPSGAPPAALSVPSAAHRASDSRERRAAQHSDEQRPSRPAALTLALTGGPPARQGALSAGSACSGGSGSTGTPAVPPSPRQPDTPRNKSNPRPLGVRAVPLNPIQAMKQRKVQQQQDAEERRLQQLEEAEERRLSKAQGAGTGSSPPSPQAKSSMLLATQATSRSSSPAGSPGHGLTSAQVNTQVALVVSQLAAEEVARPPLPPTDWGETLLTPLERRQLRQAVPSSPRALQATGEAGPETPRGNSAAFVHRAMSPSSATDRLKDRIRQRDATARPSESRTSSSRPEGRAVEGHSAATSGWKDRIEARQRESEEHQAQEAEQKQVTTERSCLRNDAMRRVMERQAQRQQDVDALEA